MKWDDLLLNFETISELRNLLAAENLTEDQQIEAEKAMISHK